ncbi:MAG TPA: IS66 family insertion sequence element accessory protein TnpB [Puia sp.]|nr:IS66 family insertion sequence element accessory protein TnpB [Puia sp.]
MQAIGLGGDGLAIYYKRLSRGTFGTPVYDPASRMMVVEKKDLLLILEGVEIRFRKRYSRSAMRRPA